MRANHIERRITHTRTFRPMAIEKLIVCRDSKYWFDNDVHLVAKRGGDLVS